MSVTTINILFALVIAQLLLLSFLLFTQKRALHGSNILLGYFFFFAALNLLDIFFLTTGAYFSKPWVAGWGSCIPFLFGPLVLLYVQSVLQPGFVVSGRKLMHGLPFLFFFLATEIFFLLQPAEIQTRLLSGMLQHHIPDAVSIIFSLLLLHILVYGIATIVFIARYQQATIKAKQKSSGRIIAKLSIAAGLFIVVGILSLLNVILDQPEFAAEYLIGFNILLGIIFIYLLTVLLKMFDDPALFSVNEMDTGTGILSPKTNALPARHEKEQIARELIEYMGTNKPWLDPELTLQDLAVQLSLKPKTLSQVINEVIGQNFSDFVNRYRIDEAVRLLTDPNDKKIAVTAILSESGFSSKSAFNTHFKRHKGLTPTEFRRKIMG